MCTVSWIWDEGEYQVFCNRDERHTRSAALPPALASLRGVHFIAPADGDHGGSWIGVNQFGVSLCLLNLYGGRPDREEADYTSRGRLLIGLMDVRSISSVRLRLSGIDLSRFRPFTLLALELGEPALVATWDGNICVMDGDGDSSMPLISSGGDMAGVASARLSLLGGLAREAGGLDANVLLRFHTSHEPESGPYSPCMHHEEAGTVSFSRIRVFGDGVKFSYQAGSPCSPAAPTSIFLDRR